MFFFLPIHRIFNRKSKLIALFTIVWMVPAENCWAPLHHKKMLLCFNIVWMRWIIAGIIWNRKALPSGVYIGYLHKYSFLKCSIQVWPRYFNYIAIINMYNLLCKMHKLPISFPWMEIFIYKHPKLVGRAPYFAHVHNIEGNYSGNYTSSINGKCFGEQKFYKQLSQKEHTHTKRTFGWINKKRFTYPIQIK